MYNIANTIPAMTNLMISILPLVKSSYRRDKILDAFKLIIQILCDELEASMNDRNFTKVYVNPHGLTIVEIELALSKDERGFFDQKIAAIRAFRSRSGMGLKESKDIIEKFQRDNA